MDLSVTVDADSILCRVSGDVDISCSPALREQLLAVLEPPRPRLVLDLSEVTFMDASGLGALMAARRRSLLLGGGLRLVAPSSSVRRVLEASGLRSRFPVTVDTSPACPDTMELAPALRSVRL